MIEDFLNSEFDFNLSKKEKKISTKKFEKKATLKKKGGYRLVSVDLETLKEESTCLSIEINKLAAQWQEKNLTNQDFVSLYIIIYLNKRYPNKFLESTNQIILDEKVKSENYNKFINITSSKIKERLDQTKTFTVFDLINRFELHGIPKSSRIALVKWYLNIYDIVPMLEVATVKQVIELQANKKRCVTLPVENLDQLVENHRDALSFVLHDLQHAYKMFDNDVLLKGQVAFSILMLKILDLDLIQNFLKNDQDFLDSFNYLVSDMNSHTKHLFFHFKTCLLNAFKRKYNLGEKEHLTGVSLEDFNNNFELILELFEMNNAQKDSARSALFNQKVDGQFNSFDFTILNDFFLNLYNLKFNKL